MKSDNFRTVRAKFEMRKRSDKTGHSSKAVQIVARLFGSGAAPRSIGYVQGWFVSGDSAGEIDKALGKAFEEGVYFEDAPRGELVDALPRLREKAGYGFAKVKPAARVVRPMLRVIYRAAVVLLPLAAVMVWNRLSDERAGPAAAKIADVVRVEAGENGREVSLSDGSQVSLSPGATLEYAGNFAENRMVRLYGEASFIVAEAAGSPFTADCGALTVTVTGTRFVLRSAEDGRSAEIRLTEGEVTARAGGQILALTAGQVLAYDGESGRMTVGELGKGERLKLAGRPMEFDDETLEEVFTAIGQYHGVTIEIRPGVDTGRRVVIGFNGGEPPGEIMDIIRAITGNAFAYTIDGDKITVLPNEP